MAETAVFGGVNQVSIIPDDALIESWDSVYQMSLDLAAMIDTDCEANGNRFDAILAFPRGSYYPVNIISREFGFAAPEILHACVTSYDAGTTSQNQEFRMGQMPTKEQVEGKNLLIIEEVCDTGNTLAHVTSLLQLMGVGLIKTGVLHYKPTNSKSGFKPDYFVQETDKWIVYPWEIHEQNKKLTHVRRPADAIVD